MTMTHRGGGASFCLFLFYLRQPSCAGRQGPDQSHRTGRMERGHTSEWQISGPEPPETSDLRTAAASPSSHPAFQ